MSEILKMMLRSVLALIVLWLIVSLVFVAFEPPTEDELRHEKIHADSSTAGWSIDQD